MGLLDKLTQNSLQEKEGNFSLEKQEIEFILSLIKETTFKGEHIEVIYNVVYKLQQQYINK